jgi:hypothetical protein
MKPQSRARDTVESEDLARHEPGRDKAPEYTLEASWYCTMKSRRVYPLVVRVPPGQGSVPIDSPSGVVVTLRAVVPGALVAPAELPLEVSRPGAAATFHVTPLARGRLPEARVLVLSGRRPVHELPVRMAARTQRLAWTLLVLALVVPALLVRYTHSRHEPLRGQVLDQRQETTKNAAGEDEVRTVDWFRPGSPGEVLRQHVRSGLHDALPEFAGSASLADGVGRGLGDVYDYLCVSADSLHIPFWVGVLLLILAVGAWARNRPARVRGRSRVALAGVLPGAQHGDATAETLPLAAPPSDG